MFTGLIHPGELERLNKTFDAIEQDKRRAEAERAEAARPVDWQEYKTALDKGNALDILRLKVETCPEDTRALYADLQNN